MKKAILILMTLCAFGTLAYAGPEQLSGKEMKQVAPMPPPCPSWTGFYIGGFAGYKFGIADTNLDLGGGWDADALDRGDRDLIRSNSPNNLDTSGAEVGGLIGYNYQWNKWVFGLEASGGYLWLDESHDTGHFIVPATRDDYTLTTSFKTHYLVTVGPRIGYAFCKWLPYVTGGLAIGDIEFRQEISQFSQGNVFFQEGGSTSDTQVGWMLGGGLEYAMTDHWRARAQYQYVDLGDIGFNHSSPGFTFAGFPADYTGHSEVSLREHNASVAIIYGF